MADPVDRVIDALNARDLDAFVACYAADATIEGNEVILARGTAEIRARYEPMLAAASAVRIEPLGRFAAGAYVCQQERVTGRDPGPTTHLALYEIRDGLIARERLFR